jgi:hypothetical protein
LGESCSSTEIGDGYMLRSLEGVLTASEVEDSLLIGYTKAEPKKRILYRCWKYYCEGIFKGGRLAPTFSDFSSTVLLTECLVYVKGFLIDTTEFGGIASAVTILLEESR